MITPKCQERTSRPARSESTIKCPTNLEPHTKTLEAKNLSGTLKNGAEPSIFFRKSKVLGYAPCKKKTTNGHMPDTIEG